MSRPKCRDAHYIDFIYDSTLDKPYAEKIEPVHRHWSGKHKQVVRGVDLVSLVWSGG